MRSLHSIALSLLAVPIVAAAPLGAARLGMFVTSISGSGDLSTWDDAGGETGLAAADAVCQARAGAAGLPNPTAYRAWLSDGANDAYCRLHNLDGKRVENCGQAELPATAGPWWRTDGQPFAGPLHELLDPLYKVLNRPAFDETGIEVSDPSDPWTGTLTQGEAGGDTCENWTSAAAGASGWAGSIHRTAQRWATDSPKPCSAPRRIYCFETGSGNPLPVFPASRPLAFVTSAFGRGDLSLWPLGSGASGTEAGDQICQSLATNAGVRDPASFRAWLSAPGANAADRFANHGPWVRLDGILIAPGLDGLLESSIHLLETGSYLGPELVWTGTLGDGTASASTCDGWTSSSGGASGMTGVADATLADWTQDAARSCNILQRHLYCLQDTPLLFFDGFESGAFWAWSAASLAP